MCRDAARHTANTLDSDGPPIVLVPGVMGSRLEQANGGYLWDPDDTVGTLVLANVLTVAERGRLLSVALRPPPRVMRAWSKKANVHVADGFLRQEHLDRGWAGPAWGFYGAGLVDLQRRADRYHGKVYGFGYDWRKSNLTTGPLLAEKIAGIRQQNDNKKVLVVTHSMGGLVTRAACCPRVGNAEQNVLGVVHTLHPAWGTPLAYRLFKKGAESGTHWLWSRGHFMDWVADHVLARIQGRSRDQYTVTAHGLRGPFELLPNHRLHRTDGNELDYLPGQHPGAEGDWLDYEVNEDVNNNLRGARNVYGCYEERSGVLGIIDWNRWDVEEPVSFDGEVVLRGKDYADSVREGLNSARRYHIRDVADYVHPNTTVVAGTGLEADVKYQVRRGALWGHNEEAIRQPYSDGTVALASATALTLQSTNGIAPRLRQFGVSGAKHADAFGASADFRDKVWSGCQAAIAGAPR